MEQKSLRRVHVVGKDYYYYVILGQDPWHDATAQPGKYSVPVDCFRISIGRVGVVTP